MLSGHEKVVGNDLRGRGYLVEQRLRLIKKRIKMLKCWSHNTWMALFDVLTNVPNCRINIWYESNLLYLFKSVFWQVFGDKKFIAYDDLNELKYLDKFINEVLRYHPIVSVVSRQSGAKGLTLCEKFIPSNTTVHINIECVQVHWFRKTF